MNKQEILNQVKESAFQEEIQKVAGGKLKSALKASAIAGGGLGVGYLAHALKDKMYGKNRKTIINPHPIKELKERGRTSIINPELFKK